MDRLKIDIGEKVAFNDKEAIIIRIINLTTVSIEELKTNIIHTVKIRELRTPKSKEFLPKNEISSLTEKQWNKALERYHMILPILDNRKDFTLIQDIADKNRVHYTTIYRWLNWYDKTGSVSSLIGKKKTGGKGKSRLNPEVDELIKDEIAKTYLDRSRKSINKTIRNTLKRCRELGISPPHANTIRNRIRNTSEEEVIKARYGSKKAKEKFEPIKSHFPGANYPLSIVQIDHTKLDIILVDEHFRKPFKRPWLTLAMDIYSRMVVGFYLSFDPPGEMGTGLCIANSILPKETWLQKYDIDSDWPCWGLMKTIHLDNAKEFRGKMLERACINYGIDIEFRPVATPHWGGHVERLLGTFSKEIHDLPGTTFSNISERDGYKSEDKASLTINDLEKWLLIFITQVYHKRIHSSIHISPIQKYEEGIVGNQETLGTGLQPRILNERRVRLDFMPYFERTVQEYGVLIDHIFYYDDVLRKHIHSKESSRSNSSKKKFIFKRDPRDISTIYFFDPELNDYFEIPYRNTSHPPMSIWEYNHVIKKLTDRKQPVDEDSIFRAYDDMEEIEESAIRK
ncbi:MAG: Mu transposase C-terminal domain-containing protein, partial [Crocinitomicaceae bacterium]